MRYGRIAAWRCLSRWRCSSVRRFAAIAETLGMDSSIVQRKPFPLMGLGARIIGEVTPEKLAALLQSRCDFQRGDSRSRAE